MPSARTVVVALFPLLALLAAGCSSLRVRSDWDHEFSFADLHTYSWAQSKESAAAERMSFLDRRIKRAVDAELAAKGFERRDSGGDFLMVYTAKVRDRTEVHRYAPWYGVDVRRYKEGTLVLGAVDRGRNEVVWTGWAEGIVSDSGQSEEAVREACAKILEGFPPR
jgi:hypothetical protein